MIFEKNKCDIRDRQHLIHNGTYNLHTFDNFFEGGTVPLKLFCIKLLTMSSIMLKTVLKQIQVSDFIEEE